jgi:transposase-like protein
MDEIVELCQRGDRSAGQVARDFDLTEAAVREWVRQAERDDRAGKNRDRHPNYILAACMASRT